MSDQDSEPTGTERPFRDPQQPFRTAPQELLRVPLVSDPQWLYRALFVTAVACVAASVLYFHLTRGPTPVPFALALIPGLALATFACSLVAWVARRKGGTLELEMDRTRLALRSPDDFESVLDRTEPYGAALLTDPRGDRRVLVLSQHGEPVLVLEQSADKSQRKALSSAWEQRHVVADLAGVPLSAATPNAVQLVSGQSLDPVLERFSKGLDVDVPICSYVLTTGEVLRVDPSEVRLGARSYALDGSAKPGAARVLEIRGTSGEHGSVLALETAEGRVRFVPFDPNGPSVEAAVQQGIDAIVPPAVFALLVAKTGAAKGGFDEWDAAPPSAKAA